MLKHQVITRDDGELFNKLVNDELNNGKWYDLILRSNALTRDDGDLYYKAVNNALEDQSDYFVLYNKLLTSKIYIFK